LSTFFKNLFLSPLEVTIIDETNFNRKELVEPLVIEINTNDVRKTLKGKKVKIIIPKDFGETVYNYSIEEEKELYNKNGYSKSQGHFAASFDEKATEFRIIVNNSAFDELQYFSTIFHEFTHVLDFNNYINNYGNPMLMDRKTKHHNYYFEFYLWSEYNAKKIGLQRLLKEYDKKNWTIDLPRSTSLFIEDVERESQDLPRLYNLMHYFARISVCDDGLLTLNSEIYPKNYLINNFGKNAEVLHTTMESIKSFTEFENEKTFLRYLLNR
jgi:hypothetical protein